MRRLLLACALGAFGVGCGGGGGGGPTTPTIPGTLAAAAVEGSPTPAGGVFGAFAPDAMVAAWDDGWVAFVADVVGGSVTQGLFVMRPAGDVVLVYGKGETVPNTNGGSGTIDDFERIWMRANGVVVTHVEISGGSGEGFLAARVTNVGTVVEKTGALYLGRTLPDPIGGGTTGTLAAIVEDDTQVDDQGDIFLHGVGSNGGLHGIFTVNRLGTLGPNRIAITGETVPAAGTFGFDFPAIAIDRNGQLVAFVATMSAAPSERIFATFDGLSFAPVAANLDAPPESGGRLFDDVHDDGPLLLTWAGGNAPAIVTWRGSVSAPSPDHGVYARQVANNGLLALGPLLAIVGPNTSLTGVGGGVTTGAELYPTVVGPDRATIGVDLAGGSTSVVFVSAVANSSFQEIFRQGTTAPGGSAFSTTYPSLFLDGVATDRAGSFALSAILADATTGVFWAVAGSAFFTVAKEGDAAPGTLGGAFGSFAAPSVVVTARNTVVFRALVVGGSGATGIFRQG